MDKNIKIFLIDEEVLYGKSYETSLKDNHNDVCI
jgi:hypothetical protein